MEIITTRLSECAKYAYILRNNIFLDVVELYTVSEIAAANID